MFRWYVVNTYSGHENKVKHNLEHRVVSLGQQRAVPNVVVPTESVSEMKDNQKITVEKRTMPGYVLVNMELNEDSWGVVKGTPGVTGFVGASQEPVPLAATADQVDRLLHKEVATATRTRAESTIGESVKVVSGPLSDFSGGILEINDDAAKLKVLVSIFGRETPVEVGFDQVKSSNGQEGSDNYQAASQRRPGQSCATRRSVLRWASTASTSWSSARLSMRRRRAKTGHGHPGRDHRL